MNIHRSIQSIYRFIHPSMIINVFMFVCFIFSSLSLSLFLRLYLCCLYVLVYVFTPFYTILLATGIDCFFSFDILLLQDVRLEVSITSRYLEVFFLCHVNASYIKCVEVILEAHASPNLVNANGETPLMLAVNAGLGGEWKRQSSPRVN